MGTMPLVSLGLEIATRTIDYTHTTGRGLILSPIITALISVNGSIYQNISSGRDKSVST